MTKWKTVAEFVAEHDGMPYVWAGADDALDPKRRGLFTRSARSRRNNLRRKRAARHRRHRR